MEKRGCKVLSWGQGTLSSIPAYLVRQKNRPIFVNRCGFIIGFYEFEDICPVIGSKDPCMLVSRDGGGFIVDQDVGNKHPMRGEWQTSSRHGTSPFLIGFQS